MLDLAVLPFKRTWQKVEQEIGLLEIAEGKKIVDQNIQLEVQLTISKEQAILFERMHGRRTMHQMAPKEYLPLTDPNRIDVADKQQQHHLICKPCCPRYGERQKANKKDCD
jgi:hypothetical protein